MQIETLKDVLNWTRDFHQHLASCLHHCNDRNQSERARLLLEYLAEHEQKLVAVLDGFTQSASAKALNTWCYEYLDKHPIVRHAQCDQPFAQMSTEEIISEITGQHGQVIDLYRYLHSRAQTVSAQDLLAQLLDLEEHEAMRMAQSANRLEDL